jgi:hypothetical protein
MELREALGQISEIRAQMSRAQSFAGFRSLTVGFSGVLGLAAALFQANQIDRPMERIWDYVDLWSGVAVLSLIVVGAELAGNYSAARSSLRRRLTVRAIQQFIPCLIAGAAVTAVIVLRVPEIAWMLPGLWAILFGLGVFASSQLLPRPTFWIGVHYLASGTICLVLGGGAAALSPWMMTGTFGLGQLLAALILYYTLERGYEELEA